MTVNGKPFILVVEDDMPVRNLITTTLESQDYKYETAANGNQAVMAAASGNPDIILMDLGLPDMDGIEVIRKIRTWSVAPVIVISARSDDRDKVEALDAGADDYLTKPFSVEELLARLRSTFRRISYIQSENGQVTTVFTNGDLKIDFAAAEVHMGEKELHLSPIEYRLLCELARNVGKVLTHQYLVKKVWENVNVSDIPSLRVYMATLRKKIEPDRENPRYIQTRVGIGYKMNRL